MYIDKGPSRKTWKIWTQLSQNCGR